MLSKAAGLALALICASAHAEILHAADKPGAQDVKLSTVTPAFVSDFFLPRVQKRTDWFGCRSDKA